MDFKTITSPTKEEATIAAHGLKLSLIVAKELGGPEPQSFVTYAYGQDFWAKLKDLTPDSEVAIVSAKQAMDELADIVKAYKE